jgi:hypothetical protein
LQIQSICLTVGFACPFSIRLTVSEATALRLNYRGTIDRESRATSYMPPEG